MSGIAIRARSKSEFKRLAIMGANVHFEPHREIERTCSLCSIHKRCVIYGKSNGSSELACSDSINGWDIKWQASGLRWVADGGSGFRLTRLGENTADVAASSLAYHCELELKVSE